jgi:glucose/arabinose dehydrogenase
MQWRWRRDDVSQAVRYFLFTASVGLSFFGFGRGGLRHGQGSGNDRKRVRAAFKRGKMLIGACCLALGFVLGLNLKGTFQSFFGVPFSTFIRAPLAYLRVHERGWDSLRMPQYTQNQGGIHFRRELETTLLPLIVDGGRLTDAYPAPKFGGAIAVVGKTVIILDRLGNFYRYDLASKSFGLLPGVPKVPNNLDAYLAHRPGPPVNLADAVNDYFRARDVIFLPERKQLVAAYDKFDGSKIRTVVSFIAFDSETLTTTGEWRQIFASDTFNYDVGINSGGGILAYRADKLYLTLGDHFTVKPKISEDPASTFGKIIEINLTTNGWRQFSKGHRNQEGLTFLKSGQLLSTEHGPFGGDELNVITEGSDYGWPNATLGTEYHGYDWSAGTTPVGSHAGYKLPLFAWLPGIATSQLIEIKNFNPRWDGDLLIGTLKATSLYRLRLAGDRVLYSEPIWIGQRIRDLKQADDGTIVLWTDDTQLLTMSVDKDLLMVNRRTPPIVGTSLINNHCVGCHHFGPTNPTDFAPSLTGLLDRPIASDNYNYSPALRAKRRLGKWTPKLLSQFITDPTKFAVGTTMLPVKVTDDEIGSIVDALASASKDSIEPGPARGVLPADGDEGATRRVGRN